MERLTTLLISLINLNNIDLLFINFYIKLNYPNQSGNIPMGAGKNRTNPQEVANRAIFTLSKECKSEELALPRKTDKAYSYLTS